ncbi:MAG: aldo/keto reductase [Candidatus Thorarchaeota archaeon]|nr:MAG: aldo/keto reductase [Candidatus Thorarchaeota archaeon]
MIQKQEFGHTGHQSTRVIFGAYALSKASKTEADTTLTLLQKYGVNHIDTAPSYGNAEERIGPWMEQHRDEFFIATKSRSRSYDGAWKDLQQSLRRLRVDQIDLWQMHGLTNPVSWDKVMGPGGALDAFIEARDKGLVRFLGITGHGPKVPTMHKQSLERFAFDTILLPYNFLQMQLPRYTSDFHELVEICHERNIALQTIKSIVRRPWGNTSQTYNTYFYQPLETQEAIDKSVHWSLGLPDSFLVTAGDLRLLPKILDAATRFVNRPSDTEMRTLVNEFDMTTIRYSIHDFK